MIILASDEPPEPYEAPRGTCPDCGSPDVQHVVTGPFEDRSGIEDPGWVHWTRDIVRYWDRECETCGLQWWCEREPVTPVRLLSSAGAAFALLPAPTFDDSLQVSVDIELLSPDRLVRYLDRAFDPTSIAILYEFWMKSAEDSHPELTVPTFQEDEAQFSITVLESTDSVVTMEFAIVSDLTSELPEHDRIAFDIARSDLVGAALEIAKWPADDWIDEEWDA